jgi:hypothetical protein
MRGIGGSQDRDADRNAQGRAQHHRPDARPVERAALHPHRVALHQEPERQDHSRGLHRAQDVEPDAGGDEAEGKAREPDHSRGDEGGEQKSADKQRWIETPDHAFTPSL